MNVWLFSYSASTTTPPTANQIRIDVGAPYTGAAHLWIRYVTTDGIDIYRQLAGLKVDSHLYLQDKNDHARAVEFRLTAAPIDVPAGAYFDLPIAFVQAVGAALAGGQDVALVIAAPGEDTPDVPPGASGASLLTLTEAKDHLRITTTVDDVDIQRKVDQASTIIRDYLKSKNDPTWTPATVPLHIKSAVALMLTHLWDHRGEDAEPDAALWDAVIRLLARKFPYSFA